jgi:simple sugar transport system ATP-binding protein
LDEPTSILTPKESEDLFDALKMMVEEDKTIIFITHKLEEVLALSQRVTILRRGKLVDTLETKTTSVNELARKMVGRTIDFGIEKNALRRGEITLEVKDISALNDRGLPALVNVSFIVREREIFGIAGIAGNGQKELIEIITGLRKATLGYVLLKNENILNRPSRIIAEKGVAHVPEERIRMGIVPDLDVSENLILRDYGKPEFSRFNFLNRKAIRKYADELILRYEIVTPGLESKVKNLSGGNIQKLILARELSGRPSLVIASHPTYGLDVGASEQIRKILAEQRNNGAAVLLISEDLNEILALSDRIAVMFNGHLVSVGATGDVDIDKIGALMGGHMGEGKFEAKN